MAEAGRELWIHRKKSSKVYWVIGRIAGSSVDERRPGAAPACARRAAEWSDSESAGARSASVTAARTRSRGCRRVRPSTP